MILFWMFMPQQDRIDDMKDSFYKELEYVFDEFSKDHMTILLGDFSAKVNSIHFFSMT
jgi:hypothetical protein